MNETNYHTIIHKPYSELTDISVLWADTCQAYAIAEHEADDEVPRTHCHILMIGCNHKKDYYQKKLALAFVGINGRKDFRFNTQTHNTKDPITKKGLWYLMKGDAGALKFSKNFSNEEVEEALRHYDPQKAQRAISASTDSKDKINQWKIVLEIREKLQIKNIDLLSNGVQLVDISTTQATFSQDYNHIMDVILDVLDKYEIKTGMYDIERWFVSVVRQDQQWRSQIKDKIFSKLRV